MNTLLIAENLHKSYSSFQELPLQRSSGRTFLLKKSSMSKPSMREHGNTGGKVQVLCGVSIEIMQGEILAIVGSSGAGKSTLLHVLGALDEPDDGSIVLRDYFSPTESTARMTGNVNHYIEYNYSALKESEISQMRNSRLGFIFQFHHLLPEFTALENVMMPLLIAGVVQKNAEAQARELLLRVGLQDRLLHKPDALSGGEQQRVAFARAISNSPSIVFADEPTGNLDAANSTLLFDCMQKFRADYGTTFVLVTHSMELAQAADRCLRLQAGRIVPA